MGETLRKLIKERNLRINPLFNFLSSYLSTEKIIMLQTINEDNLIDEEMFCSFFLCNIKFYNLMANANGFVNYWECMIIIYLLKTDIYKTKVKNILKLFIFDESESLTTQDNFYFMVETFINSIKKLFSLENEDFEEKEFKKELDKEIESYYLSIFKSLEIKDCKISIMENFLENDDSLYNLLYLITQQAEDIMTLN